MPEEQITVTVTVGPRVSATVVVPISYCPNGASIMERDLDEALAAARVQAMAHIEPLDRASRDFWDRMRPPRA